MNDALRWLIALLFDDIAVVVSGIVALTVSIETIRRVREWLKP